MEGDLISSPGHKTVLVSSENLLFINFKRYSFYLSLLLVISSKNKQSPGKNLEHYWLGLVSVFYVSLSVILNYKFETLMTIIVVIT